MWVVQGHIKFLSTYLKEFFKAAIFFVPKDCVLLFLFSILVTFPYCSIITGLATGLYPAVSTAVTAAQTAVTNCFLKYFIINRSNWCNWPGQATAAAHHLNPVTWSKSRKMCKWSTRTQHVKHFYNHVIWTCIASFNSKHYFY